MAKRAGAAGGRGRRATAGLAAAAAALVLGGVGLAAWKLKVEEKPRAADEGDKAENDRAPVPYVLYVPVDAKDRGKAGTTVYVRDKAYKGYNLYAPKPESAAVLVDMNGEVVHRWSSAEGQSDASTPMLPNWRGWTFTKMAPNGDLFAIIVNRMVLKLDWDSKVIAKIPVAAHHDVNIGDDGTVYICTSEPRLVDVGGARRVIFDDGVAIVSPEGEVRKRISFYDVFSANKRAMKMLRVSIHRQFQRVDRFGIEALLQRMADQKGVVSEHAPVERDLLGTPAARAKTARLFREGAGASDDAFEAKRLLHAIPGVPSDVFHLNAVVALKKHEQGLWKDGDLMASFRSLDLVIVFDPTDGKIEWMWGPGHVSGQHQPSITPKGNVLVLDNGSFRAGRAADISRVLELDPVTKERVWAYMADPPQSFFSVAEGGAQVLPNDDVFITTEAGRAFEVTRAGELVWEYYSPKVDAAKKVRAGFYRVERLPPSIVDPLLAAHAPKR